MSGNKNGKKNLSQVSKMEENDVTETVDGNEILYGSVTNDAQRPIRLKRTDTVNNSKEGIKNVLKGNLTDIETVRFAGILFPKNKQGDLAEMITHMRMQRK
jgi:hypothetical protein